ncbi:protein-tyrosine phosphatase [Lachnospiraceae bacterium]|nr:protein-tyrosine phosphatase [Lachnospiraceae bacterium]
MQLFDIHCHILPGVDDGSRDMESTMDMLGTAYDEGTREIILTPHYMLGRNSYKFDALDEKFENLKKEVEASGKFPDLKLYLGNEILYEEGIVTRLREGRIHTMNNTRYILVEYNIRTSYKEILHSIDEMTQARYWPIIAHVERYLALEGKLDRIEEIIDKGCLLQMNISSVDGGFLNENKRWCRKLITKGYITFLGTDAHNNDSRAPYTQEYIAWIRKKCGEEEARWMLEDAAKIMIKGQYID